MRKLFKTILNPGRSRFFAASAAFVIGLIPLTTSAQTYASYSHDSGVKRYNTDWMTPLRGTLKLSQLSIPGTHETLSTQGTDLVECQTMALGDQLNAGIRAIDIRLGPGSATGQLTAYHGSISQNVTFDEVMGTVISFLIYHKNETVIMRVDNESPTVGSTYENGLSPLNYVAFNAAFLKYWTENQSFIWNPATSSSPNDPTVNELRGKILILDNFYQTHDNSPYGLPYEAPYISAQDKFTLAIQQDLYNKWEAVEAQLAFAGSVNHSGNPSNVIFMNYLSGSMGSTFGQDSYIFPYFVASGKSSPGTNDNQLWTGVTTGTNPNYDPDFPRVNCVNLPYFTLSGLHYLNSCSIDYLGTNYLANNWIEAHNVYPDGLGLIMVDFPGPDLIGAIAYRNFIGN